VGGFDFTSAVTVKYGYIDTEFQRVNDYPKMFLKGVSEN
jgi:hypothetical protein